jgi:transcriptional regulator GlxA family with amidase domain
LRRGKGDAVTNDKAKLPAWADGEAPERIGFLLVPQFSMIGLFSAVEPLRVANRLSGRKLYSWHIFSHDGAPVASSNGMSLVAEAAIAEVERFPTVVVCASFAPQNYESKGILAWLRRLDRQGSELGAIDTGTHILARAGLLTGHRATLHWENLPSFSEEFPDIEVTGEIFEVDRKRFTCSGGTAALDLMLQRISARHGQDLAISTSESLLHARIRNPDDHQRMALGLRLRVSHPGLLRIVRAMEANLEEPLGLEDLCALGGISRRQLERLFRGHLDDTPTGYYLKLRLRRARQLLEHTSMSVLAVSLACGFLSAPYFSRAYRGYFGRSPRDDRRLLQGASSLTGWYGDDPSRLNSG